MSLLLRFVRAALSDIRAFSHLALRRPLYGYQLAPARAIVDSVVHQKGLEFAVMFPRQSGKNETQAQVEAYLLMVYQDAKRFSIIKAQPTMDPQGANALARLERVLDNAWLRGQWWTHEGRTVQLGAASA